MSSSLTGERGRQTSPGEELTDFLRQFHNDFAAVIDDPSFTFFNYGMIDRDNPGYTWIRPEDHIHRYQLTLVRQVLEPLDLQGMSVLEVSSGCGGNCEYLLKYSSASLVCGVDLCEGYLTFARRAVPNHRLRLVVSDATSLPFPDESVDVVLNIQSSHCYSDLGAFLREAYRVLKSGGTLAHADIWGLDLFKLDWQTRLDQLNDAGFSISFSRDVTEEISLALQQEDGFGSCFLRAGRNMDPTLLDSTIQTLSAIRSSLEEHRSSYWIHHLTKKR